MITFSQPYNLLHPLYMTTAFRATKQIQLLEKLKQENSQLRECILLLKQQLTKETEANKALNAKFAVLERKLNQCIKHEKENPLRQVINEEQASTQTSYPESKQQLSSPTKRQSSLQSSDKASKISISPVSPLALGKSQSKEKVKEKGSSVKQMTEDYINTAQQGNQLQHALKKRLSIRSDCSVPRTDGSGSVGKSVRTYRQLSNLLDEQNCFDERHPLKGQTVRVHERRLNYFQKLRREL